MKKARIIPNRNERIKHHLSVAGFVGSEIGEPYFKIWAVGVAGAESDYGDSPLYHATGNPFGIKAGSWERSRPSEVYTSPGNILGTLPKRGSKWRTFPTLTAAYNHLWVLMNSVAGYRQNLYLLRKGDITGFVARIAPIYEPGNTAYPSLMARTMNKAAEVEKTA